ncbi:hypothetical protein VCHA34P116_20109 [Vibrio chagasii]|nr:hypothetical protein VCHA34P116_20109 [Vibrio chagasii]CAH6887927.1 hypothetical protein VCHA32P90_20109 [Vibrio chagasii]CAH6901778.1 hypothetical protein VCHA35O137_20416 [Vibrio chagasii]CAH7203307.1 hypothetical protein VCHA53O469_20108 [Vibrio chagasii]CAH7222598.1 hypothetical protein VCHA39P230_20414 [Vibrio chagasii]
MFQGNVIITIYIVIELLTTPNAKPNYGTDNLTLGGKAA